MGRDQGGCSEIFSFLSFPRHLIPLPLLESRPQRRDVLIVFCRLLSLTVSLKYSTCLAHYLLFRHLRLPRHFSYPPLTFVLPDRHVFGHLLGTRTPLMRIPAYGLNLRWERPLTASS